MDGLLVVDKPQGLSSHDVVAHARRLLRQKSIGHAGTLDPLATGVLVLCVGQATRLSEYLLGKDKAYTGVIRLGQRTTTDDAEGEVIATRPVPPISEVTLRRLEAQFTGEIEQIPPQFSAIQKGGQRAYALARKGEHVELAPRRVMVYELQLAPNRATNDLHLFVRCSAGTYIRALARDIGEALSCGGYLVVLRRIQSGPFTLDDAVNLEELEYTVCQERAESLLLPMDRAVADWPAAHLSNEDARRLRLGQAIALSQALDLRQAAGETRVRVYDSQHVFIAIAHWDGTKLKPTKVFNAAPPLIR